MKLEYISRKESRRLILIYAGWSTLPHLYRDIEMPGWDVAVAYDYGCLGSIDDRIAGYDTTYLFAWSLGVCAADHTLSPARISKAFAINGTVAPVSDLYGIPAHIFAGTRESLTPDSLRKFRRRMMSDSDTFRSIFSDAEECDERIRELAEELRTFEELPASPMPNLNWTRAYVAADDRIFPCANMRRAWLQSPATRIVEIPGSHYPDLQGIISGVIADTEKVSDRFQKAFGTYDSHAIAQQMIALHLGRLVADRMADISSGDISRLLEIGPGTGFLTSAWRSFLHPESADFVDIASVGPFDIGCKASYHKADAERWIADGSDVYDIIMSASAIQWFADIPRFIRNCARRLRAAGILAISTFAPGNLGELDNLRPAPLIYPSAGQLKSWLEPYFEQIHIGSSSIRLEFESRRHLLMHLKHTGVAGSSSAKASPAQISTLTYKPLFILCTRRQETCR